MNMEIVSEVQELCREKGVELLYIFFTGSRAYGYNKEDSDYDALFVFKRPLDDYLRVHPLPDEIKVEDKDVTPYVYILDEQIKSFKEKCEIVKNQVKDFDYKQKDEEKMKLMDDFVYKVITEKI